MVEMPENSETIAKGIIWAAIVGWPIVLIAAWGLNRRWRLRYERLGESSSEEIIDELQRAYTKRCCTVIRTSTEYLPFVFEWIREVVDSGFDELQTQTLLGRIDYHRPGDFRQAVFPVEVGGRTSDLLFQWSRDSGDRVRIRITAAPKVIRAIRLQKRKIPKVAMAT